MNELNLDANIKANILIVDDQENNLIAMRQTLDSLNATIFLAHSGMEALQLLTEHEFAIILLDIQMPGMDGFETAQLIRKNKRTENLPIVFVTAINRERVKEVKGFNIGEVDFLFKPVDPYILQSKVQIFLDLYYQKNYQKHVKQELSNVRTELEKTQKKMQHLQIGLDDHNGSNYDK